MFALKLSELYVVSGQTWSFTPRSAPKGSQWECKSALASIRTRTCSGFRARNLRCFCIFCLHFCSNRSASRNRIGGLCSFARLQLQTPHIQLPKDAQFIPLLDLAFTSARSSMRVLKTSGPCTGLTLNMPKRQTRKHVNWNSQKASEPWIQSHEKVS